MAALPQYLYIAVLGIIFGFGMAFGIGANDVANAFGSSVAAGSLSLGWAIILGSIAEFAGAMLIGANVASTIKNKIVDASYYTDDPAVLMLGLLTALMVASTWLMIATANQFPVSTTHDIVASIIGFSLAAHGFQSVNWGETWKIFVSWFTAPLFAGIISSIFFKSLLEGCLKSENVFERALKVFPLVVFVGITANLFFIMEKSQNNLHIEDYGHRVVLPVSLGGGALCALLTWYPLVPFLRRYVTNLHEEHEAALDAALKEEELAAGDTEVPASSIKDTDDAALGDENADHGLKEWDAEKDMAKETTLIVDQSQPKVYRKGAGGLWDRFADNTFRQDLKTESLAESSRAAEIWSNQEVYDLKTERLFSYLQVFTAFLASFAHGGNDVANAIGPVSGILAIYQDGVVSKKNTVERWLLAMGGAGICLGFLLYGYKIIKAVGYKLTAITPSRGFCIELAASLAVSLASFMQLPVSTTQCLVGATCGVGLASGGPKNVEWYFLARTLCGWIGIFFIVCTVNAGFFGFVAYSPSL